MLNVYMITCDALADPVTVVARDSAKAFGIFHLWRETHAVDALQADAEILMLTAADLSATPQLADAVHQGIGVAWWTGHREGWAIGAPDGEARGLVAPPVPNVHCFIVTGFDEVSTVYVFAETRERAIATLHLYSLDQSGCDAEYDKIEVLSPWLLMGPKVTLREEMFEGETGIGNECDDGFWRIFPADYHSPLRKRDESER